MSDGVHFEATLKIEAPNEQTITDFCIAHLKARGFMVELRRDWERPAVFCRRVGLNARRLSFFVHHPNAPFVDVQFGKSKKRITFIAGNSEFEKFCRRSKS